MLAPHVERLFLRSGVGKSTDFGSRVDSRAGRNGLTLWVVVGPKGERRENREPGGPAETLGVGRGAEILIRSSEATGHCPRTRRWTAREGNASAS